MRKLYIIIIVILVLALVYIIAKIFLSRFKAGLENIDKLEINDIDLNSVEDGDYIGSCSAFPVSAEVKVTVKNHTIKEIELIKHNNGRGKDAEIIPQKVTDTQSLSVDTVSGATYSSKVILKAIHDALVKAGAKPLS